MIQVEAAGLCCIQDLGRHGQQHLGIGVSGAMDRFAAQVANSLLGNDDNAAVLEITLGGARFQIQTTQWFSITGADLDAEIDGLPVPLCAPVVIKAGSVLRFKQAKRGCRAYLAVSGGFIVEPVFGSRSTDARSVLGGYHGRWLQRGDTLDYGVDMAHAERAIAWHTSWAHPAFIDQDPLPFIPGEAWLHLTREQQTEWTDQYWTISKNSDRMGIRLTEALHLTQSLPTRFSSAVAFGSIQLPPDGHPIILAADRQTTGGYPVIGTLSSLAYSRLAQAKPGDTLQFAAIDLQDAQQRYRLQQRTFREWQTHMRQLWQNS
jgi:antagonist of KipI